MKKSKPFIISILLNVGFILLFIVAGVLFIVYDFHKQGLVDARPKGEIFTLNEERVILSKGVAVTLPAGTMLQESTPQGAATLGKISHREYLLVFSTDRDGLSTNSPYAKAEGWMEPYTLAAPSFTK